MRTLLLRYCTLNERLLRPHMRMYLVTYVINNDHSSVSHDVMYLCVPIS